MKEKKHTQDGLARANASIIPLIGHRGNIRASAWSPDGAAILTGSEDGTALLWDLDTERETRRFEQKSDVTAVAWSPDGKRFLIGCADGTTTLRDSKRRVGQAKRGPPLGVRDRKVGQAKPASVGWVRPQAAAHRSLSCGGSAAGKVTTGGWRFAYPPYM